jgi:alpha-tubulin suppressor-like RCC1 family protein
MSSSLRKFVSIAASPIFLVSAVADASPTEVRSVSVDAFASAGPLFESVSSGSRQSCAITVSRNVYCWGAESDLASPLPRSAATLISDVANAESVSVGSSHVCATLSGGSVRCWGENIAGQLGDGTTLERASSVVVRGLSGATSVGAGRYHTCASLASGRVMCWGANHGEPMSPGSGGQLGDGTTQARSEPTEVLGLSNAVSVSIGVYHSCALLADTSAACWGWNNFGTLGDGSNTDRRVPVVVSGLSGVKSLAAGVTHTCALLATGRVFCWGGNSHGQLGNGTTITQSQPVEVLGIRTAVAIDVGSTHSCALLTSGSISCWGSNSYGQLGDGSKVDSSRAVEVPEIADAVGIGIGQEYSCSILSSGVAKCWGKGGNGELGDGKHSNWSTTPVRVKFQSTISFPAIPPMTLGSEPVALAATSNSGLPVSYIAASTDPMKSAPCKVSGGLVSARSVGICRIMATEAASEAWTGTPGGHVDQNVTISDWTGTRTNVLTTLKFITSDGTPVTGRAIKWSTASGDAASGGPKTTDSDGKVTFGAVSGPALLKLSFELPASPNPDRGPGPQFLDSFETVTVLKEGTQTIDIGAKPPVDERTVEVQLPDGTPVRDAVVYNFAKDNGTRLYTTPISAIKESGEAVWKSNQITSDGGLGNCSYGNTPGTGDLRAVTDRGGRVTLQGWMTTDASARISACFNDGELKQEKSAALELSGITVIKLSYAARVTVNIDQAAAGSDGAVTIPAKLVDETGAPLSNKLVIAVQETSNGQTTKTTSKSNVQKFAGCTARTQATSGSDGRVTLRLCPTASGYWFLKATGLISSKSIFVKSSNASGSAQTQGSGQTSPFALKSLSPKVGTTVPTAKIARFARLSIAGGQLRVVIATASRKVCRLRGTRVVALTAGTCVATLTSTSKKSIAKRKISFAVRN